MDYKEKYKSLSDYDLIEIIKNEDEFDSIAISEAKSELNFRDVDFEGIIEEENNKAIESKVNRQQKRLSIKNKTKDFINKHNVEVEDYLHNDILNKSINIFVGILILFLIYDFIKIISFLSFILFESEESNLQSNIAFIFQYIFRPIMIYFFWKRSKIGWFFVHFYYFFKFQVFLVFLFNAFDYFTEYSYLVFQILFYLIILISLNHKSIILMFEISNNEIKYYLIFAILQFAVFWYFELYEFIII